MQACETHRHERQALPRRRDGLVLRAAVAFWQSITGHMVVFSEILG